MFGIVNDTMALARQLTRSDGSNLPIIANTKPTYGGGPLLPPYAGWVEPAITRALVARWSAEPQVARIVYWYFPENELALYHQPSLSVQRSWWESNDAFEGCVHHQ